MQEISQIKQGETATLPRKRVLESVQKNGGSRKKMISIVAQAGQGKTTFARQLGGVWADPFSWYQIGAKDRDPVYLISSLASILSADHSATFPLLQKLIDTGEVAATEPQRFAKILADEIAVAFKKPLRLFIDDFHLIEDSPFSIAFLREFMELSADRFRFVVLSRREILSGFLPQSNIQIDNESLALSRTEVAELCNFFMQLPMPSEVVQRLYSLTEGWVMGAFLALQSTDGEQLTDIVAGLDTLQSRGQEGLLDYFQSEVLKRMSVELRQTLIRLSLLENIPLDLAQLLSTVPDIGETLHQLSLQNCFVRPIGDQIVDQNKTFALHHLLQEALRNVARQELSLDERNNVFSQASEWFSGRNQLMEALDCSLQAHDYRNAELLLQQVGLALVSSNRILTLKELLNRLPEEQIRSNAWLSLYCGVMQLQTDPSRAYEYLELARERFAQHCEAVGEFLATTQLIFYHCLIDARFDQARPLLQRAEALDAQVVGNLNVAARFHVATTLSTGFSYINSDIAKADHYSTLALRLAEQSGSENYMFSAYLAQIFLHGYRGDWIRLRQILEQLTTLSRSPAVSELNKSIFFMSKANLLEMEGDFTNYAVHRDFFLEDDSFALAEKTIIRPFFLIWDADIAIARGDFDTAQKVISEALSGTGGATTSHLRSQYCHYHAYLSALLGNTDEALAACEESLRLRGQVGGRYFVALNWMIIGATYVQLELWEKAQPLLERAIEFYLEINNEFDLAGAYAHRAWLRLKVGDENEALEDIRQMLNCMRKNDYVHFFSWTPCLMEKLLDIAVNNDIEVVYAQKLLAERLGKTVLADGSVIPLLQVRMLGPMKLVVAGQGEIEGNQLTPGQRDFIALLAAAPEEGLSSAEIQLALWTESVDTDARNSFDNFLSCLRKILNKQLGEKTSNRYLVLKKGILSLCNVQLDLPAFKDHARQGLRLIRRKKYWQAENSLSAALALWRGPFAAEGQKGERTNVLQRDLGNLYLQSAEQLAMIYKSDGRSREAIRVAEGALKEDPAHPALNRIIHDCHAEMGNLRGAQNAIRQYGEALANDEFSAEEIEIAMESFWANSD